MPTLDNIHRTCYNGSMMTEQRQNPWTHRIYGRERIAGGCDRAPRFKPFDLKNCKFVTNLIYASMLNETEANKMVAELNEMNPTYHFVVRPI